MREDVYRRLFDVLTGTDERPVFDSISRASRRAIREILVDEQEHLIDLATALGEDPPNLSTNQKGAR